MSERQHFGPTKQREAPQDVNGLYLIGRYFVRAKLLPELERAKVILRKTSHDDRRPDGALDQIVNEIRKKVNDKSGEGSEIGNKITSNDVAEYIRQSLNT
jgi:hypothetical protein